MTVGKLAIGGFEATNDVINTLAPEVDLQIVDITKFLENREALESEPPVCFLIDATTPDGLQICSDIRMSNFLSNTPIVAVITTPWSKEVQDIFTTGVDDYLPRYQLTQIKQKVFALRQEGAIAGAFLSGKVLIADTNRERRVHLARHLRKMGMEIQFSVNGQTLPSDVSVKLVLANYRLPPDGVISCFQQYRLGPGAKIPWIITGNRKEIDAAKTQLNEHPKLQFFDTDTDPAQIIFTANQLLVGAERSLRRSPRLIYETAVAFNGVGGGRIEWGYMYNINRGGLYVRTLTPPALGLDLSLEFTPPFGRGRVQVDGKVVWRQEYSKVKGYPPGFGIQYNDDLPVADQAALEAGYNKLIEANGNPDA